jgi:hypothetical protein
MLSTPAMGTLAPMHRQTLILIALLLKMTSQTFSQSSIFVTISGGDLYKLNLSTCTSTFVGSTGQSFGDIAFTPNGKLWGIFSGSLYQIDTINASATLIGNSGLQGVSLVGLNDTTVLIEEGQNLYGIRTTNTMTYFIGNIGYSATGDLTWYDNNLYMSSGIDIIKIVLNSDNSSILSAAPVSNINSLPPSEGIATSSFIDSDNRIVSFPNRDVIKICQIDGSYQMLCQNIVPGPIPGGASIRLANQSPTPTVCKDILGNNELPTHNSNTIISPNPFSIETNITTGKTLKNASLTVYNCFGALVKQIDNINEQNIVLKRENYPSGLYFIHIRENSRTVTIDRLVIMDD